MLIIASVTFTCSPVLKLVLSSDIVSFKVSFTVVVGLGVRAGFGVAVGCGLIVCGMVGLGENRFVGVGEGFGVGADVGEEMFDGWLSEDVARIQLDATTTITTIASKTAIFLFGDKTVSSP
jgi:hypothetical protein